MSNQLIRDEVVSELEALKELPLGDEKHAKAVEDICKLYRLGLEEDKIRSDCQHEQERLDQNELYDAKLKIAQFEDNAKNRKYELAIALIGTIGPMLLYSIYLGKGFKFEESGTYTSQTLKNLITFKFLKQK